MIALKAMLVDAYRELNSKKLFWVTLVISGMVVLAYASIGFNEKGMSIFFGLWDIENDMVAKGSTMARVLYRTIFSSFIVSLWLAWVATILALISTTTIFPDFMAGGSIDLVLSKPIGRLKLFLIKYAFSLLFVLLQVSVFCAGVFFCMGWRIGEWNWLIFAAIPLVTVFFSYLYSVNVLIGTLTRSGLTALLITMLFWFSLYSINQTETLLNLFMTQSRINATQQEEAAERTRENLASVVERPETEGARDRLQKMLDDQIEEAENARELSDKLGAWYEPIHSVQTVLPKTAETIALLDRWFKREGDPSFFDMMSGNIAADEEGNLVVGNRSTDEQASVEIIEEIESRSMWYVIGTSLVFEFVILSFAAFVFCRRDY